MTLNRTQTVPSTRPSSVSPYYVDPSSLDESGWQRLAGLLKPALDRQCEHSVASLMQDIATDVAQAWGLMTEDGEVVGAVVTRVGIFPSGLRCCTILLGATIGTNLRLEAMRDVVATLERFAQDNGCEVMRIYGRKGWARVYSDFEEDHVCLQKTIAEERQ